MLPAHQHLFRDGPRARRGEVTVAAGKRGGRGRGWRWLPLMGVSESALLRVVRAVGHCPVQRAAGLTSMIPTRSPSHAGRRSHGHWPHGQPVPKAR